MNNAKNQNCDSNHQITFTDIDYGLIERDLRNASNMSSLDELRASLPDVVNISIDCETIKDLAQALYADHDIESILFELFCNEVDWMLRSASVSIPSLDFVKCVSFAELITSARVFHALAHDLMTVDDAREALRDVGILEQKERLLQVFSAQHPSNEIESTV